MNAFLKHGAAIGLTLSLAGIVPALAPALAAEGDMITDAREMAPDGLLGMWMADIEASTFGYNPPKAMWRSFAYTEDGKILVSFATHNAAGQISSGHWAAQLDGTPGIEYHSSAGSVPYNVVAWDRLEDGRLALEVSRHGEVTIEAVYELSEDGQTLQYSYDDTVVVYRRWDMVD